jgi:glutamyl-tRNA synthetase
MNGQYVRKLAIPALADLLTPYLEKRGYWDKTGDRNWLEKLVLLFQERIFTLAQFPDLAQFFFEDKIVYNPEAVAEFLKDARLENAFRKYAELLKGLEPYETKVIEEKSRTLMKELGMTGKEFIHPCRVALTGRSVSPGFFDTVCLLGRERAVERLNLAAGVFAQQV